MGEHLDESVLLSTMSPRANNVTRNLNKKMNKLALKKQIRRSSVYDKLPRIEHEDIVLLSASDTTETISTSSSCSTKCAKNHPANNGAIISKVNHTSHNPSILSEVEKWVANVNLEIDLRNNQPLANSGTCNMSQYTDLSTVMRDNNKIKEDDISNAHFAFNSTFISDKNCFRMDEMFHKQAVESVDAIDELVYGRNKVDIRENNEDKSIIVINDSFDEKQCLESPVKTKTELESPEKLLDELYGNSWRLNKERILTPQTEPNQKRKVKMKKNESISNSERKPKKSITHKNPYLISEVYKTQNLLRTLHVERIQSMIESPCMARLKEICDTESSLEDLSVEYASKCNVKLDFSDSENETDVNVRSKEPDFDRYFNKIPKSTKKVRSHKKNVKSQSNSEHIDFLNIMVEPLEDKKNKLVSNKKINTKIENKQKEAKNVNKTDLSFCISLDEAAKNAKIRSKNVNTNSKTPKKISEEDEINLDNFIESEENKLENILNELTVGNKEKVNSHISNRENQFSKSANYTPKDSTQKNNKGERTHLKKDVKYFDSSTDESDDLSDKYAIIKQPSRNYTDKQQEKFSFLASLSAKIPIEKCDGSARIYRNTYKTNKEELAKKLFNLYNDKIFENQIPGDIPLEWNDRMRGTAGYCYCRRITRSTGIVERSARIVLATKILDSADRLRDTLVHEMCHAATWIVNEIKDGHGKCWKAWAAKAIRTFPELPPIKRCHDYVVNTKYTYKCVDCGYSIGRHSKSLDIERKRCGYCYGKFEVFLNKTSKNGLKSVTPATPKQATGFALFVKENYGNIKKQNMNHADVMKILSKKFNELKTK